MEIRDITSAVFSDEIIEQYFDLIIQKCIGKLARLLEEYPNEKHKQQFLDIKKRYNNPELKLAVIGEFNTGKSTFINALLKKNYLSTDNVPTTVIPTYIRWNGKFNAPPAIKVKLVNGDDEYVIRKSQALLERKLGITLNKADDLERITTNNDFIGTVSHVTVSFPADSRFNNFCLIDTPGVNPGAEETKEHANITRTVLREEADATIILFPANVTGNRSALEFISENASHLLGGAAFVITKSDIIDSEKEMEKIAKYLKGLVKQRYGLDNQTIYTCSAKRALAANENGDASNPYLLQFNDMVEEILRSLGRKRKQIIFKKVSALLSNILNDLRKEQNSLSQKLENDIKILEKYSLENLEKEYSRLFLQFEKDLNAKFREEKNNVSTKVSAEKRTTYNCIEWKLDNINGFVELKSFASDDIKWWLDSFENSIKDGIRKDVSELESIYSAFSKRVFSRLKEYQLGISTQITKRKNDISNEISPNAALDVSIDGVIGGLGIGALILLFINPVTLVAVLAVGWLFSAALLQSMKNNIKEKVENGLNEASGSIEGKWKSALEETKSKYLSAGKNMMNDYKRRYAKIFQNRKIADSQERERIEFELLQVNESLKEIDMMEFILAIPAQLKSYEEADKNLISHALYGDTLAANMIAEKYRKKYGSTKNEEHYNLYRQWSAYSSLLEAERPRLC